VGSELNGLQLCNAESGEVILGFDTPSGVRKAILMQNDSRIIAVANHLPWIREWTIPTGEEVRTFQEIRWQGRISMALNGATRSWWNTETGLLMPEEWKAPGTSIGKGGFNGFLTISPDGTRAFSWSGQGSVKEGQLVDNWARLWDLEKGEIIWFSEELPLSPPHISPITFSPDSIQFVTASIEGGIVVRSATNGAEIRTLGSGQKPFTQIGFSPDGKTLLTWTDRTVPRSNELEGVAHLWNIETGEKIRSLAIPVMTCVAFSPDGTRIAVGEYGEFRGH
jgi:WD40 repeat protein